MKNELLEKLQKLKEERKTFVEHKCLSLHSLQKQQHDYYLEQPKLSEDLNEVDREIETLEHVITNSVTLAISLINPIKEKERIRYNISRTTDLLDIENQIKKLLAKLKQEHKVENKIHIILEANSLIKVNHSVFDTYREQFLKESQDVLAYLHSNFDELKEKLYTNVNKEGLQKGLLAGLLTELDKIGILTYKLTNDEISMCELFDTVAEFIARQTVNNKLNQFSEDIRTKKTGFNEIVIEIREMYSNLLKKIASILNYRKISYFKEFGDYYIFNLLIRRLIKYLEPTFEKLSNFISQVSENVGDNDLVCDQLKNILESFELFKFFIFVLNGKINKQDFAFFDKINSTIYDLGEKYCTKEIKFMKDKIFYLFKEESKKVNSHPEKFNQGKYDDLLSENLHTIDDIFFIFKVSGTRAIESLNVQISLAIINNIKNLLQEDLIQLLDNKISTLLVKTDAKNITYNEIKYICKDELFLSSKFTYANYFLISCINSIDQSRNNISPLLDEFKELIIDNIKSPVFDPSKIELENHNNNTIEYFNKNQLELINHSFTDVDLIINRYDEFLTKKLKIAFEFLVPIIKSTVDTLNSTNYFLEGKNLMSTELSESFSVKFIEESEKYLKQWKSQLSEGGFNKFISIYTEHVTVFIENLLLMKRYSTFGVIVLEKDINKIVNYFQAKVTISIREKFVRLLSFVKVLNFENKEELLEHLQRYRDIKLNKNEIEQIRKLKKEK
jgi:hypothetical protein